VNSQTARSGLAVGNFVLTVVLFSLAFYVFDMGYYVTGKKRPPPADASVPNYNPVVIALPAQSKSADPYGEYAIVWTSLEKPPPPPPPPPAPVAATPTIENLEAKYRVIMVRIDPEDPKLSSCILEPRTGGDQTVVAVGDKCFSGYTCSSIQDRQEGNNKVVVVTLVDAHNLSSPIRLKRE
jgi:hypothetical protein